MGFREFYEIFYQGRTPNRTSGEGMRHVLRAYRHYRCCLGLADTLEEERQAEYDRILEYHCGACALAEFAGEEDRTEQHRERFLSVMKDWIEELHGRRPLGDRKGASDLLRRISAFLGRLRNVFLSPIPK